MASPGDEEVTHNPLTELQHDFEDTPPEAESDNAGNVELDDKVQEVEPLNGVIISKKEEDTEKE